MKLLVALSFTLALVYSAAADCTSSFNGYLNCIAKATQDSSQGRGLDVEFSDDFDKHVDDCFDPAPGKTKCVKPDLTIDVYGENGPLSSCDKCQKYGKEIRDKIFGASPSVKKCFREAFTKAVVNDILPCIKTKMGDPNFSIGDIPDFDANAEQWKDIIEKTINHRILAYNRMGVCKANFPDREATTESCMKNTKGLYPKHCGLSSGCVNSAVTPNCKSQFTKVKDATCKCMDEKRTEWHNALDKVWAAVFNPEHSSSICSSGVKAALGHWVADFQAIIDKCAPKDSGSSSIPNVPLDKLIDLGCVEAEKYTADDKGAAAIKSGFRMVRNVLDALNDRIMSFCDVNCF